MKKFVLPVFVIALSCALLSFTDPVTEVPLPVCTAVKKALPDVNNHFASLKGDLIDKNEDGSENFALKIEFEGFASNQYVTSEEGGYIELFNQHPTKAKALAQHAAVAKQLETCLGVKPQVLNQEGLDRLWIYKKDGAELALVVVTTPDKSILMLSIEKETEE